MSYLEDQLKNSAEYKLSFSKEQIAIAEKYLEEGTRLLHDKKEWEACKPVLIYCSYGSIRLWGNSWKIHTESFTEIDSQEGFVTILSEGKWMRVKFATPIVRTKEEMKISI